MVSVKASQYTVALSDLKKEMNTRFDANRAKLKQFEVKFKSARWTQTTSAVTSPSEFFKSVNETAKLWDLEPVLNKCNETSTTLNLPMFALKPHKGHKEDEDLVGRYFKQRCQDWNKCSEKAFFSKYKPNTASMGSKKPDMVHYRRKQPETDVNVVLIGSLKRRNPKDYKSNFSDEQKGQLVDHMRILLLHQRTRKFSVAYLSDGYRIQFFKLWFHKTADGTRLQLITSYLMFLHTKAGGKIIDDGGKRLLHFLSDRDYASTFGYGVPQNVIYDRNVVQFQEFVGSGRFGNVYQVIYGTDNSCLLKFHIDPESLRREKENLETVKASIAKCSKDIKERDTFTFTQLVGMADDEHSLLLKPRGIPFAQTPTQIMGLLKDSRRTDMVTMSRELLSGLVDAVHFLHKNAELVHRDIKLSNMFALQVEVIMMLGIGLTRTYLA